MNNNDHLSEHEVFLTLATGTMLGLLIIILF